MANDGMLNLWSTPGDPVSSSLPCSPYASLPPSPAAPQAADRWSGRGRPSRTCCTTQRTWSRRAMPRLLTVRTARKLADLRMLIHAAVCMSQKGLFTRRIKMTPTQATLLCAGSVQASAAPGGRVRSCGKMLCLPACLGHLQNALIAGPTTLGTCSCLSMVADPSSPLHAHPKFHFPYYPTPPLPPPHPRC